MSRRTLRLIVFAVVLILGITAGVAGRRAQTQGRAGFVSEWTVLLARPFLVSGQAVASKGRSVASIFRTNSSLKRQNAALAIQNDRLRRTVHQMSEAEAEAKRLRDLLSLSEKLPVETVTARVLVRPATPWAQTCTIGAGSADGVKVGSAVVSGRGLVGMVFTMQPRTSQVLLLRDPTSSVASLVQRTRAPGICSGDGGEMLRMMYIPLASDVRKGDSVLSSGDGGVFPKGIIVGTVESVTTQSHEHFKTALIRPAVEPRSLEEVLVVVERP